MARAFTKTNYENDTERIRINGTNILPKTRYLTSYAYPYVFTPEPLLATVAGKVFQKTYLLPTCPQFDEDFDLVTYKS